MRSLALLLICALVTSATWASDYAREARFAQEISAQLVVGDAVQIPHAAGSSYRPFLGLFAEAAKKDTTRPAIVLAHGVGTHPDEGLAGELRKLLHDMGYTTLSIQMPIGSKEAVIDDYFPKLFPEAGARLQAAAQYFSAKGYAKTVLVSHTMGSWMANVHFDQAHATTPYKAWVCISLTGGYSFATRNYPFPILDLYGENDIKVTVSSAWRRAGLLKLAATGSQQVMIAGADEQWRGRGAAAAQAIDRFLKTLP
jgi:hypothetical protein